MYHSAWTSLNNGELGIVVRFNCFSVEKMWCGPGHMTNIPFSMFVPFVSFEICWLFFQNIYIPPKTEYLWDCNSGRCCQVSPIPGFCSRLRVSICGLVHPPWMRTVRGHGDSRLCGPSRGVQDGRGAGCVHSLCAGVDSPRRTVSVQSTCQKKGNVTTRMGLGLQNSLDGGQEGRAWIREGRAMTQTSSQQFLLISCIFRFWDEWGLF